MDSKKRIELRAVNNSDKELILKWKNTNEMQHLIGSVYQISDVEHNDWFLKQFNDEKKKMFGIQITECEELIGIVGIKNINFINSNAEIYIYIGESEHRSKGYGKEALNLIVNFTFRQLNLHKLYLNVFSYNERAFNVYKKVGFELEGTLKDFIYRDGEYHDIYIMSILNN